MPVRVGSSEGLGLISSPASGCEIGSLASVKPPQALVENALEGLLPLTLGATSGPRMQIVFALLKREQELPCVRIEDNGEVVVAANEVLNSPNVQLLVGRRGEQACGVGRATDVFHQLQHWLDLPAVLVDEASVERGDLGPGLRGEA